MIDYIRNWFQRTFADPQVIILTLFLVSGFAIVIFAGDILAPVLTSIVIAYLLDGAVDLLERSRIPRLVALILVFLAFLAALVLVLFGLVPLLSQQISQFFQELPKMMAKGQQLLMQLPDRYPSYITDGQVLTLIDNLREQLAGMGQRALSLSLASVTGLITLMVYLVLVPLLIFSLLKDKYRIMAWMRRFLPADRGLANEVWYEVNQKIVSYVRGKFIEILIVWTVSYITFKVFDLNYSVLLSFMVGISVIVPYVGAAVITIPIAFIAYFQWGFQSDFAYVLAAYAVIQFLDGNLLVPLLFSEIVKLHPVAIIVAVLVFGGIWGVWGVFFAIPLATLVNAVIKAWPRKPLQLPADSAEPEAVEKGDAAVG